MCEKNCHNSIFFIHICILRFTEHTFIYRIYIEISQSYYKYKIRFLHHYYIRKFNCIFLREIKEISNLELIISLSAISSSSEYSDIIGKRSGRCTVMQNDAEVKEPIRMGGKKRSLGSVGICASDMLVWLVHSWIFTKRSDVTNNPVNPHPH